MAREDYSDIDVRYDNGVARICINRPDKLNAIRMTTYRELIAALEEADGSAECRIILLRGAGGNFTAGNDLQDLVGPDLTGLMACVGGIFKTVARLNKVLVAAVEGVAVGIGTTLLPHCDLAVASTKAKFRVPFANLGVAPEGASSVLLPLAIGQKHARDVLLTGRFFTAEEAFSWGLVNQLAEPGQAEETAQRLVAGLLAQPQNSLLATKALMRASQPDVGTVIDNELKKFGELLQTAETSARIKAFLKG